MIDPFSGQGCFEDFILVLNKAASALGFDLDAEDNKSAIPLLLSRLSGEPKRIAMKLFGDDYEYADIIVELQTIYPRKDKAAILSNMLLPQGDDLLETYIERFKNNLRGYEAVTHSEMEEAFQVTLFSNGLNSLIRPSVILANKTVLDECITAARLAELAYSSKSNQSQTIATSNYFNNNNNHVGRTQHYRPNHSHRPQQQQQQRQQQHHQINRRLSDSKQSVIVRDYLLVEITTCERIAQELIANSLTAPCVVLE